MNKLKSYILIATLLVPAAGALAGSRVASCSCGQAMNTCGRCQSTTPVIIKQQVCSTPKVRLQRTIVYETRTICSGNVTITYSVPVVRYQPVVEQTCVQRTLVGVQPVARQTQYVQTYPTSNVRLVPNRTTLRVQPAVRTAVTINRSGPMLSRRIRDDGRRSSGVKVQIRSDRDDRKSNRQGASRSQIRRSSSRH